MQKDYYINSLKETILDTEKPDKNADTPLSKTADNTPNENGPAGMIMQRPSLVHYAPNEYVANIVQNGLMSKRMLMNKYPEFKQKMCDRYKNEITMKLGVDPNKIIADNIEEFIDMMHPKENDCVFAFFSRVPVGVPHLDDFLKNHTAVKISLKKLDAGDQKFQIFGRNFPYMEKWLTLGPDHVDKLCDQNKDWYEYFAAANPDLMFKKVPHAAIHAKDGLVPPFTFKIIKKLEKNNN